MKVAEMDGALLDYWVAKAEGLNAGFIKIGSDQYAADGGMLYRPSAQWEESGPIIEREYITLLDPNFCNSGLWEAFMGAFLDVRNDDVVGMVASGAGPTPLIAAMRAYVASKFGHEVPDMADTQPGSAG